MSKSIEEQVEEVVPQIVCDELMKNSLTWLLTKALQERDRIAREEVKNLPDFKSLMELTTPYAEILADGERITHFCKVIRQLNKALTPPTV